MLLHHFPVFSDRLRESLAPHTDAVGKPRKIDQLLILCIVIPHNIQYFRKFADPFYHRLLALYLSHLVDSLSHYRIDLLHIRLGRV